MSPQPHKKERSKRPLPLKPNILEELGAVEVGILGTDGEQREEVGRGEAVAALIDIAPHVLAGEVVEVALKERFGRYHQRHVPRGIAIGERCRLIPQRRPAAYGLHHFGWGRTAVVAVFTSSHEEGTHAVALYIIIR